MRVIKSNPWLGLIKISNISQSALISYYTTVLNLNHNFSLFRLKTLHDVIFVQNNYMDISHIVAELSYVKSNLKKKNIWQI